MLMYSVAEKFACFEHSNLLKVKEPERRPKPDRHTVKCTGAYLAAEHGRAGARPVGGPTPAAPRFNYELFNRNNVSIRYWSWNYRGCWHQTCPPVVTR